MFYWISIYRKVENELYIIFKAQLSFFIKAMGQAGHVTEIMSIQPCKLTLFVYKISCSKFGKCIRR